MIKSTYIESLTLINWRGYRYQTFEFDQMITGLEGGNGAGKTTAMIGVFSVLVPQIKHLRFRNVSSATDGVSNEDDSIWGRLGANGSCYALLVFRLPDDQLRFAGVMLERETEPKIKLRRFTILDINKPDDLRYLFLEKIQPAGVRVFDFPTLRENIALLGGKLNEHSSFSNYSEQLYDWGVLPMRLGATPEQLQYANLLKNSIYGGLSGNLVKELRNYLFTEDTKLLNHVKTVQENLQACRATRLEIARTSDVHEKISKIFDVGFCMATRAIDGTFFRYMTRKNRAFQTREKHRKAILDKSYAVQLLNNYETNKSHKELDEKNLKTKKDKAESWLKQCQEALEVAEKIKFSEENLEHWKNEKIICDKKLINSETILGNASTAYMQADSEYEKVKDAFSEKQKISDEIARRVGLYRSAVTALEEVKEAVPDESVSVEDADELLTKATERKQTALNEEAELTSKLEQAEAIKERFNIVIGYLETLTGESINKENAYKKAKEQDAEYSELERQQRLDQSLPQQLKEAQVFAENQLLLKQTFDKIPDVEADTLSTIKANEVYRNLQANAEQKSKQKNDLKIEMASLGGQIEKIEKDIKDLEVQIPVWQETLDKANQLSESLGVEIIKAKDLLNVKEVLSKKLEIARDKKFKLDNKKNEMIGHIEALTHGGKELDPRLNEIAERVDGQLYARYFEDIAPEDAGKIEARLGPLKAAILVEDIEKAAETISEIQDRPEHVWFIRHADALEEPEGVSLDNAELAYFGITGRLSQISSQPVLGQRAREAAIKLANEKLESIKIDYSNAIQHLSSLKTDESYYDELNANSHYLDLPSLTETLSITKERLAKKQRERTHALSISDKLETEIAELEEWLAALNPVMSYAHLLDLDDYSDKVEELEQAIEKAEERRKKLERVNTTLTALRQNIRDLEQIPLDDSEITSLENRLEIAKNDNQFWLKAITLLNTLKDRRGYFAYADDEKTLHQDLTPMLERLRIEKDRLRQELSEKKKIKEEVEKNKNELAEKQSKTNGFLEVAQQTYEEHQNKFSKMKAPGTPNSVHEAEVEFRKIRDALEILSEEIKELIKAIGSAETELKNKIVAEENARDDRRNSLEDCRNHVHIWMQLEAEAQKNNISPSNSAVIDTISITENDAIQSFADSKEAKGKLEQILMEYPDSKGCLEYLRNTKTDQIKEGITALRNWQQVRLLLEKSIPRDIAQTDDPVKALQDMQSHLKNLRYRLDEQEQALKTSGETVGSAIGSKLRRVQNTIGKLTQSLSGVQIGSIQGIQLEYCEIESMRNLLNALRNEEELLSGDTPLEEKFESLFERVSGGKIKGEKVLDFREYFHIRIKVKRLGDTTFSPIAGGNTFSTGEAIGIGIAIMVIMQESWETQGRIRPRKQKALRFLFIDEASRLHSDSLVTITDFCEKNGIQLMVAAPSFEVASRGHFYALERVVDERGGELVHVHGRRISG